MLAAVRHGCRAGIVLAVSLASAAAFADEESWFSDIEKYALLRDTRIDVAGPEPASFTALGVSPFLTAQSLASSDIAFSAAQIVDDQGNPRAALGVDFAPFALVNSHLDLADYQHNREDRFVSRIQLSLAASKGETSRDLTTRIAPTLRVVLHEQRDPRVHRGPGSLKDCFERRVSPPESERASQAELAARLKATEKIIEDPGASQAERQEARQQHDALQSQWKMGQATYLAALRETVRQGMKICRDDPEVAAYTWNATGHAIGISPSFRNHADGLGTLEPKGLVVFGTTSYGFDPRGTKSDYVPSFLGRYAQVLGQVLYRLNEPLPDPRVPRTFSDANQLAVSARVRGGTSPWNANLEGAVLHDWFGNGDEDTFYKLAVGTDLHVYEGTWVSFSLGRTFWRGSIDNETSVGVSLKRSLLD